MTHSVYDFLPLNTVFTLKMKLVDLVNVVRFLNCFGRENEA